MCINYAQSSLFFDAEKGDAQRTASLKSHDTWAQKWDVLVDLNIKKLLADPFEGRSEPWIIRQQSPTTRCGGGLGRTERRNAIIYIRVRDYGRAPGVDIASRIGQISF